MAEKLSSNRHVITVGEMKQLLQPLADDTPVFIEHSTHVQSRDATVLVGVLRTGRHGPLVFDDFNDGEPYLVIDVTDEDELNRQGATLG